jgi:hypothetical protein
MMTDTSTPIEYMLTTVDNPFDPFTQFDEWMAYDHQLGYNTPSLLARIAKTSDELSDVDQSLAIQQAIDEIVDENVSGMHRKVSSQTFN